MEESLFISSKYPSSWNILRFDPAVTFSTSLVVGNKTLTVHFL
ncbi:Protein CBG27550 [Caenorhabditis briggsae]|uniref:Protein CBG27550 n=1 Tax=Caenorhabditis briggsae TaxID=6238 RepID=B6IKL4_CAEBR|nr:Protein CBG27550 [Caenorhabditis briggsae]CAS00444.1 Protein CBG27550 [Caenorhabditis briggsae]